MNAFNRVSVVILLLVAILLWTVVLVLLALGVPVLEAIGEQFISWGEFVNSLRWFVRMLLGFLFAVAVDIVLILLVVAELRRPKRQSIRVAKAAGGEVQVSVASIADGLRYEIDQLSSVLRSRSKVSAKRGGILVEIDVETAAGIDVPAQAAHIVETARRVVEDRMGLKLARSPKVNLRAVPYPSAPRGPRVSPPVVPAPADVPPVAAPDVAPSTWSDDELAG